MKIGIIGFGNMGSAIAQRIESKYEVWVFDKDVNKTKNLSGMSITKNAIDLVKQVDTVILAAKPQDFKELLGQIKPYIANKLIVSIAAGIKTSDIEKILDRARVIRVMPNIGAKIGKAESSLCKGKIANYEDLIFAQGVFNCIGKTWLISEDKMDAATAICGSGPAYIFYDMEKNEINPKHLTEEDRQRYIVNLTKAAEDVGFSNEIAADFAASITGTSIALVLEPGNSPSDLKNKVTSKGGTTEAALKVLSDNGSWTEAARAAQRRAEELSINL
jgi:pyrroline-5-carboxylate reductase